MTQDQNFTTQRRSANVQITLQISDSDMESLNQSKNNTKAALASTSNQKQKLEIQKKTELSLRIITHNIRYATPSPFKGEEPWSTRRPHLCSELLYHSRHPASTFICLQEVLHGQLRDIHSSLLTSGNENWKYIGVGRDDGKQAGEYSPIFYRADIWGCLEWKTVWLSETPWLPGRGWDAASTRILTVAAFKHRETEQTVLVMSTHLDDQGVVARRESAGLILGVIQRWRVSWRPDAVFLGGDFNSQPDDGAYLAMTAQGSGMVDLWGLVDDDDDNDDDQENDGGEKKYGNEDTFTGFQMEDLKRIDFVFGGVGGGIEERLEVVGTAVLPNVFDDGVFLSDHRAVVVDAVVGGRFVSGVDGCVRL